jgi:hypothetical protein
MSGTFHGSSVAGSVLGLPGSVSGLPGSVHGLLGFWIARILAWLFFPRLGVLSSHDVPRFMVASLPVVACLPKIASLPMAHPFPWPIYLPVVESFPLAHICFYGHIFPWSHSNPQQLSTYALTIFPYSATLNGRPEAVDFWDTAGQERFLSMHPSYYYKAHACVLVFDVTRKVTCVAAHRSMSLYTHLIHVVVYFI